LLFVVVSWWIISAVDYWIILHRITTPPKWLDLAFFLSLIAVIFFSLFNVFLTFAWVTLGLLLNPERVAAYFVGFLTIFGVVIFKGQSLAQLLKEAEAQLHLGLYRTYVGKGKKEEIDDKEFNTIETLKLDAAGIVDYFKEKGMTEKQGEAAATRILAFRRFRVRFLIGNIIGTMSLLLCLIAFILLGVEAFKATTAVTSIGSVLEGGAGAGAVVSDKVGDSGDRVKELVFEFSSKRVGNLGIQRHSTNHAIDLTNLHTSTNSSVNPDD